VENEFLVELIGELHRVEYLEMIEACVLLGFPNLLLLFALFWFFHFFRIWGFSPLQPLQYLDMVSLNRWVFLYFTSIHEVLFRMKGYKLATPVILQSEQILDCCVWLLDQIFSGFTAKDAQ
jgi:hypothetical protein